jgi:uncharacterized protein YndB with AHSA1/START domain
MVHFEAEIGIAASPARVWDVLTSLKQEPRWMRATKAVAFTEGDHYAKGARMERTGRFLGVTLRWRSEIAAVERDRLISFAHEGAVKGISQWEIVPAPNGSRVRFWSEGPAPGPLAWLPGLAAMAGRAGLNADLRRLKHLVERG